MAHCMSERWAWPPQKTLDLQMLPLLGAQLSLAHGATGKSASTFEAGILILPTSEISASLVCTGDGE